MRRAPRAASSARRVRPAAAPRSRRRSGTHERVSRELEAVEAPDRAARDLRADRQAVASARSTSASRLRQRSGSAFCCESVNDSGRPAVSTMRRHIANDGDPVAPTWKSSTNCSTPLPPRRDRRDPAQLVLGGRHRRGERAGERAVVHRARRREAERAGLDRLAARARAIAAMSSAVAGSCSAPRSPIDVDAQRRVRHLRAEVDVAAAACRGGRGTRGSVSQSQGMPSASAGAGDVLDPLHQLDQPARARRAGTGAKPTPQLPITTVVTPWPATRAAAMRPR